MFATVFGITSGVVIRVWANALGKERALASKKWMNLSFPMSVF